MSLTNFVRGTQDIMRMDAGINGDAQRIEQLVWLLFLKIFDDKESNWELYEDEYAAIIPENYQWRNWAANDEGLTGDELLEFVDKMFKKLKNLEVSVDTDRRKILVKEFFEDSNNYMKSGTLLKQLINKINEIDLDDYDERHAFNDVYEMILKDLQSAGNAGEYYTPRAVTNFIIEMLDPRLGDKVGDFACGTGGFLVSALEHMKKMKGNELKSEELEMLGKSIYGVEKKPMPHMLCLTNMMLHDVDTPNVLHENGLTVNVREISLDDKMDVIAMNPPFGGSEEDGVKKNFPREFRGSETADLFFTRIMYQLKDKGRAGVVLPDGFLFGKDSVKVNLKKKLVEEFNLHTVIRMTEGVFAPYTTIATNILFFDKTKETDDVLYYSLNPSNGRKNFAKTNPILKKSFDELKKNWKDRVNGENFWKVNKKDIVNNNYSLDFKNPNETKEDNTSSKELIDKLEKNEKKIINKLSILKELSKEVF